ncbi:MAG: LemA family protein [Candidatus Omnitrophica bacterium]|nr:LemA family protein [Candidatus Omnitrophota bacterium]MBU4479043.1 LemA family protein [Candidatus Omnitrophota bacterium]MCG2703469.1 LemA family protein [Candidatus Omnitrophota bacterium]
MQVAVVAVFFGIMVVAFALVISIYNGLITLRNRVKNGWSQIDVQLKRRYNLIPNLVETAKGYMKHERETLEKVVQARQQAVNISGSGNVAEQAKAENFLSQTLRSLFAVSERYPDLKANQNMLQLQEELTSTENKIAFARQYYNDEVMRYNTKIERFPDTVIAGMFNFTKAEFFEIEDAAQREAPQVKF